MPQKLKVSGRVDLDGTHRAFVEFDGPPPTGFEVDHGGAPRFIKVSHGSRACTCILAGSGRGSTNRLILDRFKQRHLFVRDGGEVIVELVSPPDAVLIELSGPTDLAEWEIRRLFGKPLSRGEKTALFAFTGEARFIEVTNLNPGSLAVVTAGTEVRVVAGEPGEVPLSWIDIGDLNEAKAKIRETVEYPLRFPGLFKRLGISPPKGIILYGPPGTGKTLLARALANEAGAKYYCVSGPELFTKYYGETEAGIRRVFEEASKNAPAVVVIDELDALVPNRTHSVGDQERRTVATFLTVMDGLREMRNVIVVGTTNRIDAVDPALRRGGRFEHEIHIGVPDAAGRLEILRVHTRRMPLSPDVDLKAIADRTVGFVGADIGALCREAAYNSLRRTIPADVFSQPGYEPEWELFVTSADFEEAILGVPPSAMREFMVEMPDTCWGDIGGLESVKQLLIESVAHATTRREVLTAMGVRFTRGVLLYGPPGTGKTLLGKAAAHECGANFIYVKGPEIRSKWYGESEARVRLIFERARQCAPCIIFVDEIDAIAASRNMGSESGGDRVDASIVNQILAEMDGVQSTTGVFVIGATNQPDFLDPALLRPGRFDFQIEVPLPDEQARSAILRVHLAKKRLTPDVELDRLVSMTRGFSGAEIEEVCREAALAALRESGFEVARTLITMTQLESAVAVVLENSRKLKPRRVGFTADDEGGPLQGDRH